MWRPAGPYALKADRFGAFAELAEKGVQVPGCSLRGVVRKMSRGMSRSSTTGR